MSMTVNRGPEGSVSSNGAPRRETRPAPAARSRIPPLDPGGSSWPQKGLVILLLAQSAMARAIAPGQQRPVEVQSHLPGPGPRGYSPQELGVGQHDECSTGSLLRDLLQVVPNVILGKSDGHRRFMDDLARTNCEVVRAVTSAVRDRSDAMRLLDGATTQEHDVLRRPGSGPAMVAPTMAAIWCSGVPTGDGLVRDVAHAMDSGPLTVAMGVRPNADDDRLDAFAASNRPGSILRLPVREALGESDRPGPASIPASDPLAHFFAPPTDQHLLEDLQELSSSMLVMPNHVYAQSLAFGAADPVPSGFAEVEVAVGSPMRALGALHAAGPSAILVVPPVADAFARIDDHARRCPDLTRIRRPGDAAVAAFRARHDVPEWEPPADGGPQAQEMPDAGRDRFGGIRWHSIVFAVGGLSLFGVAMRRLWARLPVLGARAETKAESKPEPARTTSYKPRTVAEQRLRIKATTGKVPNAMTAAARQKQAESRALALQGRNARREESIALHERNEEQRLAAEAVQRSRLGPVSPEAMEDRVRSLFESSSKDERNRWFETEGRARMRAATEPTGDPAVAASILCAAATHAGDAKKLGALAARMDFSSVQRYKALTKALRKLGKVDWIDRLKKFEAMATEVIEDKPGVPAARRGPSGSPREDKREVRPPSPELRPSDIVDSKSALLPPDQARIEAVLDAATEFATALHLEDSNLAEVRHGEVFIGGRGENGLRLHVLNGIVSFKISNNNHVQVVKNGRYTAGSIEKVLLKLDLRNPAHRATLAFLRWLQGADGDPSALRARIGRDVASLLAQRGERG